MCSISFIYCSVAPKCMLLSHVIIILLTVTRNIMIQSIIFSGEKKLSIFFATYYCKTHSTSIWMTPNELDIIYIAQWHRIHVIITCYNHFFDSNMKHYVTVYHTQWWKIMKRFFHNILLYNSFYFNLNETKCVQ